MNGLRNIMITKNIERANCFGKAQLTVKLTTQRDSSQTYKINILYFNIL